MAYYTGSVNSFDELLTALVNACTANGWAWSSGILSKGRAFIKPSVASAGVLGLRVEGGTGQSGASLINLSPQAPRLGAPSQTPAIWGTVTWPSHYHIHIGSAPDEVYVVLNTNVTDFYWLAFGLSTVPMAGTGLWIAAVAPKSNAGSYGMSMSETGGSTNSLYIAPAIFWAPGAATDTQYQFCAIQRDAAGTWPLHSPVGVGSLAPLINRYELAWNKAAVLLPAREYEIVADNKRRLLIDAAHARILRLGSLEPGQILQLGPDRWRVYPFYRKNASAPNSGSNHTGTFGWAIRYDGP